MTLALALVDEYEEFQTQEAPPRDFFRQERPAEFSPQATRGDAPHASHYQRAQPPRPAAISFPTQQVIAVLSAIGAVLGARLMLLLSGVGMYLLGAAAAQEGASIWPMVTFGLLVFLPVAILCSRRNL